MSRNGAVFRPGGEGSAQDDCTAQISEILPYLLIAHPFSGDLDVEEPEATRSGRHVHLPPFIDKDQSRRGIAWTPILIPAFCAGGGRP